MLTAQQEGYDDNWKIELREEIIKILTGGSRDKQIAFWKIGQHYNCTAPASLYKYYKDKTHAIDSIKDNKMWYSAPCKFNDVFDCDISVDDNAIFNAALEIVSSNTKIRVGSPAWKEIQSNMRKETKSLRSTFETMKSTMGVACLSESDDSLLMWAHYANNHRGMCVEYDLMEINTQLGFTPVPIIYSNDRVCFNTLNPATAGDDTLALFIESITSKSEEWRYEREWRIIRDNAACGDKWDAEEKGALLDMICPSSITLGCAAEAAFEVSVKKFCEDNRISMYKMEKDKSQYKLNKVAVLEYDV